MITQRIHGRVRVNRYDNGNIDIHIHGLPKTDFYELVRLGVSKPYLIDRDVNSTVASIYIGAVLFYCEEYSERGFNIYIKKHPIAKDR